MKIHRAMNPRSLANLDPQARNKGKQRFNTTLRPETIAWLQAGGNASERIEKLVGDAQAATAEEEEVKRSLESARGTLQAVEKIYHHWYTQAVHQVATSPRWRHIVKLLRELHDALHHESHESTIR